MKKIVINPNITNNSSITCQGMDILCGPKKHKKTLINNFSYVFKSGVYAIVGNSGVGKTTLVNHLDGLTKTATGDLYILNNAVFGSDRKIKNIKGIRKSVSMVFQFPEYQIFKDSVEKDIAYGPINNNVNKTDAYKLASKYLYLVGLDQKLLKAHPFDLSNGQKRLVAIAGVLALETPIVIFDEPTAGLDLYYQNKVKKIIKSLKQDGKTVIIITHNMDNVLELADEVLVLHDKKLIASGTPYEIFNNAQLLNSVGLKQPNIIKLVNKLAKLNKAYANIKPLTLDDLANEVKKGGI
ncbi:MAG: ATP-binding cassette domain-containing protein [Mycoplasmoidaceae bacterium]|nr:ATP-binding cassette domain-containing protein [Mycoplasmoidaceae bacterium]